MYAVTKYAVLILFKELLKSMKKNSLYIKCPRCELNYIPKDESLCDMCKAELNLIQSSPLIPDEEDEILCPICKLNYISIDEDMCYKCTERLGEHDSLPLHEEEEDWRTFLDDEKEALPEEEQGIVSLTDLENEEKGKILEDESEKGKDEFKDDDDLEDEDLKNVIDEDLDDDDDDDDDDEDDEDA